MRRRAFLGIESAIVDARAQEPLPLDVTPVEDRPGAHQRRRRNHEARRPDEADPFEVRQDLGVQLGHGDQFVSGQR